jgi:DNA polymerase-3 subunit alpha
MKRIPIGIENLQILIFIGAFRFTGKQKHELLIEARFLLAGNKPNYKHPTLLEGTRKTIHFPRSADILWKMPLMKLKYWDFRFR